MVIALLVLLAVTVALDPRVPGYRSRYDAQATPAEVMRWQRDLLDWRRAPTWSKLPAPDFTASYVFGKYRYRLDVQISGNELHYVSWGTDDQQGGGAWYAVGHGHRQADGEWFSIWSCLDLSREVSNGGGAWFDFSADRRRIHVRYYHDTLPFGADPIELGEAVMVNLDAGAEFTDDTTYADPQWQTRTPEGRVRTYIETLQVRAELWGRVVDEQGRGISSAAVKQRAAGRIEAVTDARGFFRLELDELEALTLLAAGKPGYYNGIVTLEQATALRAIGPGRDKSKLALATITLRRYDTHDYREYAWVAPDPDPAPENHLSCGNCHRREHEHWSRSRHASMAVNAWTRAAFERDARPHALADGRTQDDCTPCHSPSLASTLERFDLKGVTLLDAAGVHLRGNHCDLCHKIEAVPDPDRPGMNGSARLLRPDPNDARVPGGIKRVFGPLPDVSFLYMGAAYNPLFSMSVLCAACHQDGSAQGTYREWQRSKYAAPAHLKHCQDCHMPAYTRGEPKSFPGPDGRPIMVASGDLTGEEAAANGVAIARYSTRFRPLNEAHKHSFVGTEDADFLRAGVTMHVEKVPIVDGVRLRVTLTNVGAGHAIPTGHGLKRYVLSVHGRAGGQPLAFAGGLPESERAGAAASATTGALIGRQFSNDWSVPYWRGQPTQDTRLLPDEPQVFTFDLPGADSVEVKLTMRRGSPVLLQQHGLDPERTAIAGAQNDLVVHTWRSR